MDKNQLIHSSFHKPKRILSSLLLFTSRYIAHSELSLLLQKSRLNYLYKNNSLKFELNSTGTALWHSIVTEAIESTQNAYY